MTLPQDIPSGQDIAIVDDFVPSVRDNFTLDTKSSANTVPMNYLLRYKLDTLHFLLLFLNSLSA